MCNILNDFMKYSMGVYDICCFFEVPSSVGWFGDILDPSVIKVDSIGNNRYWILIVGAMLASNTKI